MNKQKVIVTDVKYRMALSPIRELAKKGYDIIGVEFKSTKKNERLGHFSKYVKETALISEDEAGYVRDISAICGAVRPILLPVNRKSLTNTIKKRQDLNKFCDFIVPTEQSLITADDKNTICKIAKKIGVPIPDTTSLSEHESIEQLASSVNFPCIIKFRNGEAMGKKPKDRYRIVYNKADFIREYTLMNESDENPICSDYISGHDIGVAVVMNKNSQPVDFICYESLKEYPTEGGPTCYLKTIFNRDLLKYAVMLLQEIEYTGIAMLDFKGTPENPYFLEINPRVWGSAPITEISSSSFFESYARACIGDISPLNPEVCTPNYKINAYMRFTPQNFICFLSCLKKDKNKPKIILNYLKTLLNPKASDGLFSFSDMKPFIKYMSNLFKRK